MWWEADYFMRRSPMADKRTMKFPDGREVEVQPIGFRATAEHWNEYFLEDGSVIRVKLVATEFIRAEGEFDQDGNPVYFVRSQNVVAVSSPESMRRQP
jgi:hypothetical protein